MSLVVVSEYDKDFKTIYKFFRSKIAIEGNI